MISSQERLSPPPPLPYAQTVGSIPPYPLGQYIGQGRPASPADGNPRHTSASPVPTRPPPWVAYNSVAEPDVLSSTHPTYGAALSREQDSGDTLPRPRALRMAATPGTAMAAQRRPTSPVSGAYSRPTTPVPAPASVPAPAQAPPPPPPPAPAPPPALVSSAHSCPTTPSSGTYSHAVSGSYRHAVSGAYSRAVSNSRAGSSVGARIAPRTVGAASPVARSPPSWVVYDSAAEPTAHGATVWREQTRYVETIRYEEQTHMREHASREALPRPRAPRMAATPRTEAPTRRPATSSSSEVSPDAGESSSSPRAGPSSRKRVLRSEAGAPCSTSCSTLYRI